MISLLSKLIFERMRTIFIIILWQVDQEVVQFYPYFILRVNVEKGLL